MKNKIFNILIAPDSFKDCLSSEDTARFIGEGILQCYPEANITIFPVADGGEGTASCIAYHRGGRWKELTVNDPLNRYIKSNYLILQDEDTAVVELAGASGLELLKPYERNALKTSTLGTGELIKDALDCGLNRIILTIGGSATVDGGTGIAAALGFRFYDNCGNELTPCGEDNVKISRIDKTSIHPGLSNAEIIIACDVKNLLNGDEGAARVYGPQKGADEEAVKMLEKGLENLSSLVMKDTGFDASKHPGTGAAGGASLFLLAYGNALLRGGFDIVMELTGFAEAVRSAGLVISGEGKIDSQTAYGKVVASIAEVASREKKPLILVSGILEGELQVLKEQYGATEIFFLMDHAGSREDSITNAGIYLKKTGQQISEYLLGLTNVKPG